DNGAVSGALAPLKTGGVVTGILCLSSRQRAVFDGFKDLITWMAYGLSLAMERNGLYKAVVKRNLELEAIKHIGSALASSTFDLNKVFNYTMEMIKRIMKVEAGSLFLLENNHLHFAVDFNVQKKSLKKFRLKLGQGIAGHVATRGEAIIVNETRESLHFFPDIDKETGFKTRSVLCVPMISQGRVIGVLEVLNKINGDFDAKDQNLLQSIASSVSIGIENARLYEETVSMTEHERGIRRVFQKFVPKEIIDKIIHGDESGKTVLEELKTLTLLNIDIRNFSGLSRRMGPRKTVALLNHFFSVMGGVIFKNNGIVDKYLGDGFLAIFGAPASSAADADNALLAALEMQKSLGAVNDYLFENLGARVNIGISVHTGEVVAGNIGFDRKMDYTVIGDSVNEVFKLQKYTKAHLDGIIISESVRRATRLRLKVREDAVGPDGEPLSEDMKIYELLGLNSQNGGNGLGERPFMVFVGAHADLARCRRIAERLRGAGRPACISPIHLPGKGERHRIFIGGYESERAARKAAEALNRGQFPHANVVRYPYIILVGLYTPGPPLAEAEAVLASMGLAPHRDGPPGPDGRTPLFLGAFKDREEAAGLTRLLEEAGFSPEVTLR
ncbi:MAG: GAF domain-containing protein, partial [Desulfobacterales bacterium]|nr:GAF domain-containing protein [Desulfobacterales bacterium]